MRYFFDEANNTLFQLSEPPPDGKGITEISEADFKEYEAHVRASVIEDELRTATLDIGTNVHYVPRPLPTVPMTEGGAHYPPFGAQPQALIPVDMEMLARVWRKMQDKRDELKLQYEADDKVIEDDQDKVSAALLGAMNKMGGISLKTTAGTVEKKPVMKASGSDWQAIHKFIVDNNAWELLHKRLGTQFIERWLKAHDEPPPGVNVFTEYKINVKKPGGKEPPTEE